MPKYQIILQSDKILPDDEFQLEVQKLLASKVNILEDFFYIYAQNLDGIKKELWERADELDNQFAAKDIDNDDIVSETINAIQDLFKLDD